MSKRWPKQEITYLKRYADRRNLAELADRFRTDTETVRAKLDELSLEAKDYTGGAPDPGLADLEKALSSMYRERWEEAAKSLEKVVQVAEDPAVAGRAREYMTTCEQQLAAAPAQIRDPYLKAVIARNAGDLSRALALCRQRGRDEDDRFVYLAAAIYSLQGDLQEAAEHLQRAIRLDSRHRVHASNDSDFGPLRELPEFAELFEGATASPASE